MARFVDRLVQDGIDHPIEVIIDPNENDLIDIRQKRLRHHWKAAQREREGLPGRADISVAFLEEIIDFTAIVAKKGNDLTYEKFGRGLTRAYGRDMTGKQVDAFASGVGQLFRSVFLVSEARKSPVFTRHQATTDNAVEYWLRLVAPLAEGEPNVVSHFLVCSIPVAKPEMVKR